MYRREYPDVPCLFDARFSQYNQPSLSRELQKTWLISLIGILMVVVGCGLLMWEDYSLNPPGLRGVNPPGLWGIDPPTLGDWGRGSE